MASFMGGGFRIWPFLAVLIAVLIAARAFTDETQLQYLFFFKERMERKGLLWQNALQSWTCPTRDGGCDPCGPSWWGNWDHLHCRGSNSEGKDGGGGDGIVTNIHLSDIKINGPIPRELCLFRELRELDLDGGRLSGPIPDWMQTCFPELAEMDLSSNRLSGTIPSFIAEMPNLREFEVRYNRLRGGIPWEFGLMPKIWQLELDGNRLTGRVPASFINTNITLGTILLASNDFEGDLAPLAGTHLALVSVDSNPKLCGMVPASVRYAKGYDPTGTGLGKPCPEE